MPFGSSQWMYNSGADFYNGVATQSLRFEDGDSANLYKNFSASNLKTNTFSFWVKRVNLGSSQMLFSGGQGTSNNDFWFHFEAGNILTFRNITGGSYTAIVSTSSLFRDTASWYHIVLALDTTQATASNRVKIYVNGQQQTLTFTTTPAQDSNLSVNYAGNLYLGRLSYSAQQYLDGYLAETNFVDGTALDPTSFGETKNGVWIPKAYTGSYGTNGFRLQFNQTGTGTASSSTIGADTSGNANHFTSSGIVASDCDMPDSPENNFPTLNPLSSTGITYQEGNLEMSGSASYNAISTMGITEGKHYYEVLAFDNGSGGNLLVGIIDEDFLGTQGNLATNRGTYRSNGVITNLANSAVTSGSTYATGDFIGVAIDCDNGTVQFYKNNVAQGATPSFTFTAGTKVFANIRCDNATTIANANFGQDSSFCGNTSVSGNTDADGFEFRYTPPTGFKAICAKNLPEPTISPNADTQADDYFNTVIYTGNGTGQSITGVGFQPDWTWIKRRSAVENHWLTDSVRGVTKGLISNSSNAEATRTDQIQSFDTDGFTLGNDGAGYSNIIYNNYVSWNWKAGGTAVSNTDGTITSSVSANTDAGFSIVTYTGTGSQATIGHGLGKKPSCIIIKGRDDSARYWVVYHDKLGSGSPATKYLVLNTTAGEAPDGGAFWNGIEPTNSVFTVIQNFAVNRLAETYVAYCFAEIEGYSKFGSYTGNSSSDGTFVYLGFRPAWVLIKNTNTSDDNWYLADDTRDTDGNPMTQILNPNTSVAEYTTGSNKIDFTSNGIKMRDSASGDTNISGEVYIYMAFARTPFKYSLGK